MDFFKVIAAAAGLAACSVSAFADTPQERLGQANIVLTEIMQAPDKGVPQDLMAKATCVVIVPSVKKAAFVFGAKYGKGFEVCRRADGGWGAPAAVRMEGGSFGLQIGGSATDVIMLLMDPASKQSLLSSKFTLGGEASAAAGPVGRSSSAETDAQMRAKILTYSRTQGVFGGVDFSGSTLRQDLDDNQALYGNRLTNREIVDGNVAPPPSAQPLIATLDKYSYRENKPTT